MSTQVITSGQVPVRGMLRTNSVTKVYLRLVVEIIRLALWIPGSGLSHSV